ncbi:hypothetical protein PHYSODRAFT_334313 [Phytophthora sojae]|uniref:Uncharacterized protein n=1 Tax=Phytophthora sojae (strain P6497) TaxID=1094619 RepID=G4ZP45_PHYSP|nr:hypothetical protein PHYSODRAFT_334313 [Phytophthora sojae]EGZ16122.1 hypothetical protein PHYSODRAFT_334313 [Phytophthora sojae]|eukprot:XP_009529871.1 hypothetical protein PHYSODRAFT_334313 [Phytophthora sojae]
MGRLAQNADPNLGDLVATRVTRDPGRASFEIILERPSIHHLQEQRGTRMASPPAAAEPSKAARAPPADPGQATGSSGDDGQQDQGASQSDEHGQPEQRVPPAAEPMSEASGDGQLLTDGRASHEGVAVPARAAVSEGQLLADTGASHVGVVLSAALARASTASASILSSQQGSQQPADPTPASSSSIRGRSGDGGCRVSQSTAASARRLQPAATSFARSSSVPPRVRLVTPRYVFSEHGVPVSRPALVGVPATLADIAADAPVRDGDGGIERLVEGGCLSDRDFADLARIIHEDVRNNTLQPVLTMPLPQAASLAASGAQVLREALPALRYFGVEHFARRTLASPRYLHLLLAHIRALVQLVQDPQVADTAAWLTKCRRLSHELQNQRAFWSECVEVERRRGIAAHERFVDESKRRHAFEVQERDRRIEELTTRLHASEERAHQAEAASGLLETRLRNSRLSDPWSLMDFLREHGRLRGNWLHLLALLEHYQTGTAPSPDWVTRVDVEDLRAFDFNAPPYPSATERAAQSDNAVEKQSHGDSEALEEAESETKAPAPTSVLFQVTSEGLRRVASPRRDSARQLDLSRGCHSVVTVGQPPIPEKKTPTPSAKSKSPSKPARNPKPAAKARSGSAEESSESSHSVVDLTTPEPATMQPLSQPQARPSDYPGSSKGARSRNAKYVVSVERATASLPSTVTWSEVRADAKELMLFGTSYLDSLAFARMDTALHTQFRQKELMPMLESMAYWNRMDSTPWVRNVPECFLDQAVQNLSRRTSAHPFWPDLPSDSLSPSESLSPLPGNSDRDDGSNTFQSDFSSLSSHGDTGDEDYSARKRKASGQSGGSSKRSKPPAKARPSSVSTQDLVVVKVPASKYRLYKKALKDMTPQEKNIIEIPDPTDKSWRYFGILVQKQPLTNQVPQNLGFPSFVPVKTHMDEIKTRWDRAKYEKLLQVEPWAAMYDKRVKVFYFHLRQQLQLDFLHGIARFIGWMRKAARLYWEGGHWVTIDESEPQSRGLHTDRKVRRSQFRKDLDEQHEPDVFMQLAALDEDEPIRTQWATRRNDDAFLRLTPVELRADMLNPTQRRQNPLPLPPA